MQTRITVDVKELGTVLDVPCVELTVVCPTDGRTAQVWLDVRLNIDNEVEGVLICRQNKRNVKKVIVADWF